MQISLSKISVDVFEKSLNTLLSLNPELSPKIQKLQGKVIQFHFTLPEFDLFFIPDETGKINIYHQTELEIDGCISGSMIAFMKNMMMDDSSAQFFSGELNLSGEMTIVHQFGDILGHMDIDWEEHLSRLIGDQMSYRVSRLVQKTSHYLSETKNTARLNINEYLTEEAKILPTAYETNQFNQAVDEIRDDTERLAARLNIMNEQLLALREQKYG